MMSQGKTPGKDPGGSFQVKVTVFPVPPIALVLLIARRKDPLVSGKTPWYLANFWPRLNILLGNFSSSKIGRNFRKLSGSKRAGNGNRFMLAISNISKVLHRSAVDSCTLAYRKNV